MENVDTMTLGTEEAGGVRQGGKRQVDVLPVTGEYLREQMTISVQVRVRQRE